MKDYISEIKDWIYENPNDLFQIKNRAMFIAACPIMIGIIIGLIIVIILNVVGI